MLAMTELRRWPVLVGGGLLNVSLGTYYAWSVYVPALEKEFGWTRTQTSLVATIDMVMLASMFLVAGFVQRRFGSQMNALIGGTLFSLGLFLASFTTSLPMLYLTWGVMLGAGLGFGYSAPIAAGSRWYPDHLGIVNGLAIGIFAAGSGICGPIAGLDDREHGLARHLPRARGRLLPVLHGGHLPPEGFRRPATRPRRPKPPPRAPSACRWSTSKPPRS